MGRVRDAGSPPRMRGRPVSWPTPGRHRRLTPAYAGKTTRASAALPRTRAHPRVCGEDYLDRLDAAGVKGSPPRMRGRRSSKRGTPHDHRLTPAYAGKTPRRALPASACRAHPRVCGEDPPSSPSRTGATGSPPRMRGRLAWRKGDVADVGLTPAYAGKTRSRASRRRVGRAHPRVCGEDRWR